jgi:biopolymer transport protein ExbD
VVKILFVSIFATFLLLSGCESSAGNYPVTFVDQSDVFASDRRSNPLLLVVEMSEDGKLSLNKIETGTISDLEVLTEKLKAVFDDREKASINERDVVINLKGKISGEDLQRLVESLAQAKASPILVIKNNL